MTSETHLTIMVVLAMIFLVWNCFEVGRNDAANLVNAVFGSRVLKRKKAVWISGIFVVLGATFSSPVMDTVRKGIFHLSTVSPEMALTIFLSAYVVGTVLLYSYSAFGMPVSTTATLVFSLAGGAVGAAGTLGVINWPTMGKVVAAIIASIILSGVAGFMVQRIFRGAIQDRGEKHTILLLHGPWINGLIMTALTWFMIFKGLKGMPIIKQIRKELFENYGETIVLFGYWAFLTLLTHLILTALPKKKTKYLFHFTAILGMCCMSFAFGQNDLANAASPGLASLFIWMNGMTSAVEIPRYALFFCGVLIYLGMTTKNAQRVTRAEINVASQHDEVKLYAPNWCRALAKLFAGKEGDSALAPSPSKKDGKKLHYDPLRASVIMGTSASVIAFASGLGIPVSTTYVAFAAVIATGWGDRVFTRGSADQKIGRAIWVVTCWFLGALIAFAFTALVAGIMMRTGIIGVGIAVAANLGTKFYFQKRADTHEDTYHNTPA